MFRLLDDSVENGEMLLEFLPVDEPLEYQVAFVAILFDFPCRQHGRAPPLLACAEPMN
jgi:hypothetical protein